MILQIDPKIDYAFKRLFGSPGNEALLIDLLNAVLGATLPEPITDTLSVDGQESSGDCFQ